MKKEHEKSRSEDKQLRDANCHSDLSFVIYVASVQFLREMRNKLIVYANQSARNALFAD